MSWMSFPLYPLNPPRKLGKPRLPSLLPMIPLLEPPFFHPLSLPGLLALCLFFHLRPFTFSALGELFVLFLSMWIVHTLTRTNFLLGSLSPSDPPRSFLFTGFHVFLKLFIFPAGSQGTTKPFSSLRVLVIVRCIRAVNLTAHLFSPCYPVHWVPLPR